MVSEVNKLECDEEGNYSIDHYMRVVQAIHNYAMTTPPHSHNGTEVEFLITIVDVSKGTFYVGFPGFHTMEIYEPLKAEELMHLLPELRG